MNRKELDQAIEGNELLKQVFAELLARQELIYKAAEQSLAIVATAAARQIDAAMMVRAIDRMEALFSKHAPNPLRTSLLKEVTSLMQEVGVPNQPPER